MYKLTLSLVFAALLACVPALAQDFSQVDEGTVPAISPFEGPACQTIDGILGSGSPSFPGTSGTQTGRLNRNGVGSTCAAPKVCDIFLTAPGRAFDSYTIPNNTGATACVDITLDTITQAACNLQVNGYLNSFDPANICTNYLADAGVSSGTPPNATNWTANVPAGDSLVIVVHTTNPGEIGCEYDLILDGDCIGGGESDLELVKNVSPAAPTPGGPLSYMLMVTNNGPDDAMNTVVTDDLPAEFTYISDDCGAGPPAGGPPNGMLTWNVGTLANGASAVCNVTGTVDGALGVPVVNNAAATSDNGDPTPATAVATATLSQGITAIPTLSQVGLGVLLLLLALSAVFMMRRRQQV